ncbi:hypothetical protein TNCV_4261141 [Trichonephila clavipes]|nr:hypothetical protein TNCV_4261141 [Trichonephila clavipes]
MRECQARVSPCLPLDESGRFCGLRQTILIDLKLADLQRPLSRPSGSSVLRSFLLQTEFECHWDQKTVILSSAYFETKHVFLISSHPILQEMFTELI